MKRRVVQGLTALAVLIVCGGTALFSADDKPKYTTKEVMKIAHKDGLLKKVTSGKAEKEDKEKLLELYTAMGQNKPTKGDEDSWKTLTDAIVKAATAETKGEKGAESALTKATNCKACHSVHKG